MNIVKYSLILIGSNDKICKLSELLYVPEWARRKFHSLWNWAEVNKQARLE
jgi:hypothetical protein